MSHRRVDSVLVRGSLNASFFPTRGALRVLVKEVFAPGQLPIIELNTELQVPTGFTESSPDVFNVHPLVVPLPQDTEVRTWWRTYQPVRVTFLAYADCQFAMLFQIKRSNILPYDVLLRGKMPLALKFLGLAGVELQV